MNILPTTRFIWLLVFLLLPGLGFFYLDGMALLWFIGMGLLCVCLVIDFVMLWTTRIQVQSSLFVHQPVLDTPVELRLLCQMKNVKRRRFHCKIIENDCFRAALPESRVIHLEGTQYQLSWDLVPLLRGDQLWPGALAWFKGHFGLLEKYCPLPPLKTQVYPALRYPTHAVLNPSLLFEQVGVKRNLLQRSEQTFESLRPYVQGDNYRHIDWKASARRQMLITRQYELEQHHNLLICLDHSRLMGTLSEGVTKLDWAIEAVMQLTCMAETFKDNVGLVVFSNTVQKWVTPSRFPVQVLMKSMYNIEAEVVEANYEQLCQLVLSRTQKRSLVLFLSDFLDLSNLLPALPAFRLLNRRHCSLFIGIEDPVYQRYLTQKSFPSTTSVLNRIVVQDSMERRKAALKLLKQSGFQAISSTPANVVARVTEAYQDIRFSGML